MGWSSVKRFENMLGKETNFLSDDHIAKMQHLTKIIRPSPHSKNGTSHKDYLTFPLTKINWPSL